MCGIVGYTGRRACAELLLEGLRKLEYRGYDSAGIAVQENGRLKTVKAKGKIREGLEKSCRRKRRLRRSAESVIRAGRRTASRATSTATRSGTDAFPSYITGLLKIIGRSRNF